MSVDPKNLMNALRTLAADASLDATSKLLDAEEAIRNYLAPAGGNPVERRRMLRELDDEIVREAGDFWSALREHVAQLPPERD
jgi:hypothetical protein